MPNPPLLLCDSDALFQFLIANELRPLQNLKDGHGIQPVIVPEVEVELHSNKKFSHRILPILKKTMSKRLIELFDRSMLSKFCNDSPLANVAVDAGLAAIQRQGEEYFKRVGRGEAYTHAAALLLGMPVLSNDGNAVRTLLQNGLPLPSPVLRAFDLLVFTFNDGGMTESECDQFRKILLKEGERIPREFEKSSFIDGTISLYHRLRRSEDPSVQHSGPSYCKPLYLTRIAQ